MSMASYLPRLLMPIQIAMSDIRPRKLIRLAGSVLCDGRQMALGRKRKQGYKGWLTAQIYVAVARRLSSQEYMCDRLFTRPDPINAPTPTHQPTAPSRKTIYWIALVKSRFLGGDIPVYVRIAQIKMYYTTLLFLYKNWSVCYEKQCVIWENIVIFMTDDMLSHSSCPSLQLEDYILLQGQWPVFALTCNNDIAEAGKYLRLEIKWGTCTTPYTYVQGAAALAMLVYYVSLDYIKILFFQYKDSMFQYL